ncbi:hypothetical protein M407DRAFT_76816, partial [Tulasnella calospora MUT 4182]
SGSSDGTIRLWIGETGAPLSEPMRSHSDSVCSLVFSPDGKILASGSDDQTIRLWDVGTPAPLGKPLACCIDRVNPVAFSADGTMVLWA